MIALFFAITNSRFNAPLICENNIKNSYCSSILTETNLHREEGKYLSQWLQKDRDL